MAEKQSNNIIKNAMILFAITLIAGVLLGLTNEITKEPIRVQQEIQKNTALQAVVTEADTFNPIETEEGYDGVNVVYEGTKDGELVGYAFEMTATEGYGGDIQMMVGLGLENNVLGIDIVKHAETPGLGAKADESTFKSEFAGEVADPLEVVKVTPSDAPGEISSISGATITSKSVTTAVTNAVLYFDDQLKEEQ